MQYPSLYNIIRPKNITIAKVFASFPPNLTWPTSLVGSKLIAWNDMRTPIEGIRSIQEEGLFYWNLSPNEVF
ncbi:hypothetical protein Zm00014a_023608 [Zea mays]|jgi:hypothetical protein|uniref:Uncharacterized protein n=1 Tax=Zea mays TaxID=4577 RepID=A0A3L6FG29_MAIZE|nr:hypothetical protein Zm00014a_023608 [Zea mays]